MPTTPTYGLPYPALSDPPNVPADVQALAESTDAQLARVDGDTADLDARVAALETHGEYEPWEDLPMQNGWATRSGWETPGVRAIPGNRVELTGAAYKEGGSPSATVVAILAPKHRPTKTTTIPLATNGTSPATAEILPTGEVKANATGSPSTLFFAGSFPRSR